MSEKLLFYFLGYSGSLAVLIGYFLISNKKVEGLSLSYQLLNLYVGISLAAYGYYYGAWAVVILNTVWIGVTLKALFIDIPKKKKEEILVAK